MPVSTDTYPEALLTTPCHGLTEELAGLRHLLSTQQTKKRKDREGDSTLDMNQMHGHDSNSNSNGYDDKTSWIGVTIKAPAGERGRGTNAGGRLGFKTEDILKQACITAGQWSQYMVSVV